MWEFAIPNTGPGDPANNVTYTEYVRQTAFLLGLNGEVTSPPGAPVVNSGGNMLTTTGNLYPWNLAIISDDALTNRSDDDSAWFGEATFGVTEKLDITVGARISDKSGGNKSFAPLDAFRTPDPAIRPQGDPFAGVVTTTRTDGEQPKINTYKFAVAYQFADDLMVYGSYAEGFTSGSDPVVTIGQLAVVPPGAVRVSPTQAQINLPPEIIENMEIGLRSDWLDGRLRFNATYFDSDWGGMRVTQLPRDVSGNTQPFPYSSGDGAGSASGFEFEVVYVPTDRLTLNLGLGLIDTNYTQSGVFDGVTGNFPGAPFAYAPDESYTIGAQYEIPTSNGGRILLVGNYGYRGDYSRDAAYQRTLIDANGNPVLEQGYGIFNSRFVYEPAARNYSVELWGKNLTDEQYINGGFDTRDTWGYDFAIVGRAREVGVSLGFTF
jgi:iron complex outermembrane receptor protein